MKTYSLWEFSRCRYITIIPCTVSSYGFIHPHTIVNWSESITIVYIHFFRYLELVYPLWHKAYFKMRYLYAALIFSWIFGPAVASYAIPTSKVRKRIITARKRSCRKVMFLQVSVILFTGGGWDPSMHCGCPGPHSGGLQAHTRGADTPPGQLLLQAVRTLLECNLV